VSTTISPFAGLDDHWDDLVLELARLLRGLGLLRLDRKFVCWPRVICHCRAAFSAVLPIGSR
jgi:hypothetical protein